MKSAPLRTNKGQELITVIEEDFAEVELGAEVFRRPKLVLLVMKL